MARPHYGPYRRPTTEDTYGGFEPTEFHADAEALREAIRRTSERDWPETASTAGTYPPFQRRIDCIDYAALKILRRH